MFLRGREATVELLECLMMAINTVNKVSAAMVQYIQLLMQCTCIYKVNIFQIRSFRNVVKNKFLNHVEDTFYLGGIMCL